MPPPRRVKWLWSEIKNCQLCSNSITKHFIDGKTAYGSWAIMCEKCHRNYGSGLGLGRGQLYKKERDGWWKIAG